MSWGLVKYRVTYLRHWSRRDGAGGIAGCGHQNRRAVTLMNSLSGCDELHNVGLRASVINEVGVPPPELSEHPA